MLSVREFIVGDACTLCAMGEGDTFELLEFLVELKQDDRREFDKVQSLLDTCARSGPPRNQQKCRYLSTIGCFELKSPGGVRIMAFWDAERLIVCTHGFMKKSQQTPRRELDKAARRKNEYFAAKQARKLRRIGR